MVISQVHWWLAAVAFGFGMVLTFTLMARPANIQMPAWVLVDPMAPARKPDPPAMKAVAAEAPTKKVATPRPGPARKRPGSKAPPRKRRPVPRDGARDAATERIPVANPRAAKKVPGKKAGTRTKARPKRPATKRTPQAKDAATEKILVSGDAPTTVTPLIPYAPYGPGSLRAEPDGSGPEGWQVKGRTDSRLFYSAEDPGYDDIEAQVWFENEEFAAKAFFTPWRNRPTNT